MPSRLKSEQNRQEFANKAGYPDIETLLEKKYVDEGMSSRELTEWSRSVDNWGYARQAWLVWLREFDISIRPRGGPNRFKNKTL